MPIISTKELCQSELWLRRAHHVLAWIFHFYIHTHPPTQGDEKSEITIPSSLTLPLLRVSTQLELPPVVCYADSVLYNWDFEFPPSSSDEIPTLSNLRCQTLFTQTLTESQFFLLSARIELIGVAALDIMRATMDEMFVGDDIAARRITGFLWKLQEVVKKMKEQLHGLRGTGCDPDTFYNEVRPWLAGCDSNKRPWVFEGMKEAVERCERGEDEENIREPAELSGPSAGQSSLVHSLDIFLGVDKYSHSIVTMGGKNVPEPSPDTIAQKPSFLSRMQLYMPRHHRRFLQHLAASPRPLRDFVVSRAELATKSKEDRELVDAYNAAVMALKEFRDAHMAIVTLYIIGPAARARRAQDEKERKGREPLKGTGGTNLVQFLKGVRNQTKNALLPC
jgi:indoleamine 2,3-dioxygenase